jgi:hypothetical protein
MPVNNNTHQGSNMHYSPQGIEYRLAVMNLIDPINPALDTPFSIYKDAVQGRKPFPSELYCFGLFDGLVHLFHSIETIENRYFPEKNPGEIRAFCAGFEEARELYQQYVNVLLSEIPQEEKACLA